MKLIEECIVAMAESENITIGTRRRDKATVGGAGRKPLSFVIVRARGQTGNIVIRWSFTVQLYHRLFPLRVVVVRLSHLFLSLLLPSLPSFVWFLSLIPFPYLLFIPPLSVLSLISSSMSLFYSRILKFSYKRFLHFVLSFYLFFSRKHLFISLCLR